jgi:hypothetical protein
MTSQRLVKVHRSALQPGFDNQAEVHPARKLGCVDLVF